MINKVQIYHPVMICQPAILYLQWFNVCQNDRQTRFPAKIIIDDKKAKLFRHFIETIDYSELQLLFKSDKTTSPQVTLKFTYSTSYSSSVINRFHAVLINRLCEMASKHSKHDYNENSNLQPANAMHKI